MVNNLIRKILGAETEKKQLISTVTYNNQPLTIKGEAERNPLKDLESRFSGWLRFCIKINLVIQNAGTVPVDTDVSGKPIVLDLDINGRPDDAVLLETQPESKGALLGVVNRQIILEHVRIEANGSLGLVFESWFAVHVSEL
jgi:hypothetical protein